MLKHDIINTIILHFYLRQQFIRRKIQLRIVTEDIISPFFTIFLGEWMQGIQHHKPIEKVRHWGKAICLSSVNVLEKNNSMIGKQSLSLLLMAISLVKLSFTASSKDCIWFLAGERLKHLLEITQMRHTKLTDLMCIITTSICMLCKLYCLKVTRERGSS